ncbi:nucleotide pyrophosphatase [haloarchaeon 3A1-DGR]|nr:nucleotide pyrophosphatase [haloarchaeon 3A1-DGR]
MALETVVVGLDGAHFELLDPWLDDGELPNIERIVHNGVSADLESVLPPVTSPNWKAYTTGKNPGKIGIFWWENIDTERRRVHYPVDRKHKQTEFWEILASSSRVGVLGVPTTYPPKETGEFVVAGAPDGEDTGFAYPEEIEHTLRDEFDYRLVLNQRLKDAPERAVEEITELIDQRFEAAKYLAAEHDVEFLQLTTFYINSLHHFYWDHEYTLQAWKIIDEHVGDLLDEAENVVLMSDHGSNRIETVFNINTWLERNGYLSLDVGAGNLLHEFGVTTDNLIQLATMLGIRNSAERVAPEWLLNKIPNKHGEFRREQKTDRVDWDATDAIASGQGPIYLTIPDGTPEYERIRSELITELRSVAGPKGRPVASDVFPGDEVYDGAYSDEAPDIVINQAKGVHIPGNIGSNEVFSDPEGRWRAENKRHGMFAATGPAFGNGDVGTLSILDLAPTLLHLHGHPIPEDMDGDVRTDVFAQDSEAAARSVRVESPTDIQAEIERIRSAARELSI